MGGGYGSHEKFRQHFEPATLKGIGHLEMLDIGGRII